MLAIGRLINANSGMGPTPPALSRSHGGKGHTGPKENPDSAITAGRHERQLASCSVREK